MEPLRNRTQGCASARKANVKSQREGRVTESIFRVLRRIAINRWKKARVNLSRGTSKNSNNYCPTTEIRVGLECRSRPMDNVPIIGNAYERGQRVTDRILLQSQEFAPNFSYKWCVKLRGILINFFSFFFSCAK